MVEKQEPIIYTITHIEIIKGETQVNLNKEPTFECYYHYYIVLSKVQGFQWNQDLFIT